MRWGHVVLAYFTVGALMWAGGVIAWDDAGVGSLIVEPQGNETAINDDTQGDLEETGGLIEDVASTIDQTGLFAVTNLLVKFIGYVFWPITVLQSVNAPVEAVVLGGGTFSLAFLVSLIHFIRSGA